MLQKNNQGSWSFDIFNKYPNLVCSVSDQNFGNLSYKWQTEESVTENRNKFFKVNQIVSDQVIVMHVNQGVDVIVVDEKGKKMIQKNGNNIEVNGLITNLDRVGLFLLTADCIPIIFYDPVNKVIGIAHVGWGGTVGKLPVIMLAKMNSTFGSNIKDFKIAFGPSLCDKCNIQPNPINQSNIPEWQDYLHPSDKNNTRIELIRFNLNELKKVGVKTNQIDLSNICTLESHDFYSHEAFQKGVHERERRFASLIYLNNEQNN